MSSTEAIRLQNVVFGYDPRTPVLQVEELVVHAGKRVFLYGPSGSGKTTLLGRHHRGAAAAAGQLRGFGQRVDQDVDVGA